MRIVHVIPTLDMASGGPARVAIRLPAAQALLGHDVEVVAYASPSGQREIDEDIAAVPGASRVRWSTIDTSGRLERLVGLGARVALRTHLRGAALVYLHGMWSPILAHAASIARHSGTPYAFVPHGMLDPWSLAQSAAKKRLAMALTFRRALDHAAFIHALNVDEARLLTPLGLRAPAVVIPNGIFLDEVDPLPEAGAFRRSIAALGDAPYVLFLSRLHYKKGLDVLADAFAELSTGRRDVHLVVAGPDEGARSDFERRIASLGPEIAARVHVVGALRGRARFEALVDAHCFCLPSRQEGFSMAIAEALATATAVVISEACHFPEVAEVGAGEVVPLAAHSVARALDRVLAEPEPRVRYGKHGRQLVAERFTWPAIAEQTIEAYRRHVTRSDSAP